MSAGSPILTTGPDVTFAVRDIQPPSTLYIGRNDALVVDWWDRTGTACFINGRVLRPDGEVTPFSHDLVTTGTPGERNRARIELTEGFLLSVCVQGLEPFEPSRGMLFVRATLWRGTTASGAPVLPLICDYVTKDFFPAWPSGSIRSSLDGHGRVGGVALVNPAAGVDWTYTLTPGQYWRLMGIAAVLTTSAAVASRLVELRIVPGGFGAIFSRGTLVQAASLSYSYVAGDYGARSGAGETINFMILPSDVRLREGNVISVVTANLQAADQWSSIAIAAEEWIADY